MNIILLTNFSTVFVDSIKIRTFIRVYLTTGLISGIILNTRVGCLISFNLSLYRAWRNCPIVRSLSGNRIGRITVVYHRVAKNIVTTATGAEIVKKRDFGVGFIVVRFFI